MTMRCPDTVDTSSCFYNPRPLCHRFLSTVPEVKHLYTALYIPKQDACPWASNVVLGLGQRLNLVNYGPKGYLGPQPYLYPKGHLGHRTGFSLWKPSLPPEVVSRFAVGAYFSLYLSHDYPQALGLFFRRAKLWRSTQLTYHSQFSLHGVNQQALLRVEPHSIWDSAMLCYVLLCCGYSDTSLWFHRECKGGTVVTAGFYGLRSTTRGWRRWDAEIPIDHVHRALAFWYSRGNEHSSSFVSLDVQWTHSMLMSEANH